MKLVLVTFAGRKKFLQILFKYIEKYKHYIDEYHIYVSTNVSEDIEFINHFKEKNDDFVKLFYREYDDHDLWNQAWKNSQEDETIYIKLDDDIVYLDESLFTNFVEFRKNNINYPFIYPMIINNYYCSWVLQNYMGVTHSKKSNFGESWENEYSKIYDYINSNRNHEIEVRYFDNNKISPFRTSKIIPDKITDIIPMSEIFCPVGWGDLDFCINLHNNFISDIKDNNIKKYQKSDVSNEGIEIKNFAPVSINCVSWIGSQLREITNKFGDIWQDEPWISVYCPIMTGKNNYIYFNSVVSHYSYYKQSELGIDNQDILSKYYDICYNL